MNHESVASCDNIHTIPQRWQVRRIGSLDPDKLPVLARAVQVSNCQDLWMKIF